MSVTTLSWQPVLPDNRRLWLAVGISLAVHALLMLLHFTFPDTSKAMREKALDIILVNARSARKPDDPQALAQANLDGGGDTDENRRIRTPLPPTPQQTQGPYEKATGEAIVERFRAAGIDPLQMPAVLVANHGPFVWADDPAHAVEAARVLEYLAEVNLAARAVNPAEPAPARFLVDKHYLRKHGAHAYYGQRPPSS